MPRTKLPPHLIDYMGAKRCSICKMPFPSDVQPALDKAFAEHVRTNHRPGTDDGGHQPNRIPRYARSDEGLTHRAGDRACLRSEIPQSTSLSVGHAGYDGL
jgi:hypothetical protein